MSSNIFETNGATEKHSARLKEGISNQTCKYPRVSWLLQLYLVCINHGIKECIANVFQCIGLHVQTNGSVEKHAAKLKEWMDNYTSKVPKGFITWFVLIMVSRNTLQMFSNIFACMYRHMVSYMYKHAAKLKDQITTTKYNTKGFLYLVCINHGIEEHIANVFQRIGLQVKTYGAI